MEKRVEPSTEYNMRSANDTQLKVVGLIRLIVQVDNLSFRVQFGVIYKLITSVSPKKVENRTEQLYPSGKHWDTRSERTSHSNWELGRLWATDTVHGNGSDITKAVLGWSSANRTRNEEGTEDRHSGEIHQDCAMAGIK